MEHQAVQPGSNTASFSNHEGQENNVFFLYLELEGKTSSSSISFSLRSVSGEVGIDFK